MSRPVLLDGDGTLVDSTPGIGASVRAAAAAAVCAAPAEVPAALAALEPGG